MGLFPKGQRVLCNFPNERGSRKVPFQISATPLEIGEQFNRARSHHEQAYMFVQIPKSATADRAKHVGSSSGLITIVVMTLFSIRLLIQSLHFDFSDCVASNAV